MIIEKQGITAQTHEAMSVWLNETHGLTLMGSSALWIQVDREVSDEELASIMALDVSTLDVTPVPKTQSELLSEAILQIELLTLALESVVEA